MGFDQEKFRDLLNTAMGNQSQIAFANRAGLSKCRLNRLLREKTIGQPHKGTLKSIAEASDGRVTMNELLEACGYPLQASDTTVGANGTHIGEEHIHIANDLKKGVETFVGIATKYSSLDDMLDAVETVYGTEHMKHLVKESHEYEGKGRKGAEEYANCEFVWLYKDFKSVLPFILYYCKTAGGGVIVSDCAFDLATLMEVKDPNATQFLFHELGKGDVTYTDYPMILSTVPDFSAKERLLKAIFG